MRFVFGLAPRDDFGRGVPVSGAANRSFLHNVESRATSGPESAACTVDESGWLRGGSARMTTPCGAAAGAAPPRSRACSRVRFSPAAGEGLAACSAVDAGALLALRFGGCAAGASPRFVA